ncbi:MAG: TlpA family protein disulfide reductase [Ottowia sp.]|nr:TlpA family protein disulfide reductase [Ottowia sp.]
MTCHAASCCRPVPRWARRCWRRGPWRRKPPSLCLRWARATRWRRCPLLDGGRFEPAQAEGRALVLYWWASWCPFCAQQSPEMQKLWAAQKTRGLRMLALSIDKKPEDAMAYLTRRGYSFPAVWVSPEVARFYPKPDGLPVTVVRGKDGRVVQAEKGQLFAEDVAELARWV